MSSLIDIWTSELAKLREKGQTLFSNGSSTTDAATGSSDMVQKPKGYNFTELSSAILPVTRVNSPLALCSESSVAMILECVSP